jgi:hypothetical protein
MANSTGTVSYSTTLAIDSAGGTDYVAVAEVIEINGPGVKVTNVDLSNLNSPSHFREFRAGFADGGEVTFKLTFTQAQYLAILNMVGTSLMHAKITLPLLSSQSDAAYATFYGHISELGMAIPEDDRITNDVTFKVSGAITWSAGS